MEFLSPMEQAADAAFQGDSTEEKAACDYLLQSAEAMRVALKDVRKNLDLKSGDAVGFVNEKSSSNFPCYTSDGQAFSELTRPGPKSSSDGTPGLGLGNKT